MGACVRVHACACMRVGADAASVRTQLIVALSFSTNVKRRSWSRCVMLLVRRREGVPVTTQRANIQRRQKSVGGGWWWWGGGLTGLVARQQDERAYEAGRGVPDFPTPDVDALRPCRSPSPSQITQATHCVRQTLDTQTAPAQ